MPILEHDLQRFISDKIEENLNLDYKAAASLAKSDGKKSEVSKDVSAMANSAGGRIVYGISEYQEKDRQHLPERIDPINRIEFTKEWLEQVISSVQPRIPDVVITSVSLSSSPDHVVYVVDIPQSSTAHQAQDKRYYRRYNFESVAMVDHEIRDVMARNQHPRLSLHLELEMSSSEHSDPFPMPGVGVKKKKLNHYRLRVLIHNDGASFAKYINGFISIPTALVAADDRNNGTPQEDDGQSFLRISFDNTQRDVVSYKTNPWGATPEYGPSWFKPLLPGLHRRLHSVDIGESAFLTFGLRGRALWSLHADNAPVSRGEIDLSTVRKTDHRA